MVAIVIPPMLNELLKSRQKRASTETSQEGKSAEPTADCEADGGTEAVQGRMLSASDYWMPI